MQPLDENLPSPVECNICGFTGVKFAICAEGPVKCPGCRSVSRHRVVRHVLNRLLTKLESLRVLEAGGDGRFLQHPRVQLVTVDPHVGIADLECGVEGVPEATNRFDVVVCLDMLEHAPDDQRAVQALANLTDSDGVALVTASCWGPYGGSLSAQEAGLPTHHIGLDGEWDCLCYRYYSHESLQRLCAPFRRSEGRIVRNPRIGVFDQHLVVGGGHGSPGSGVDLRKESLAALGDMFDVERRS